MSSTADFDVGMALGSGAFASVHRARCRSTSREVAIKIISKTQTHALSMTERIANERRLHTRIAHPNIIALLNSFDDSANYYFVLELAAHGTLYKHVQAHGRLQERHVVPVLRQLLQALSYLHHRGIVHRDVKLSNILVSEIAHGDDAATATTKAADATTYPTVVKLCDFGLAARVEHPDEEHFTICGTPNYIAPEIAAQASHSFPVDLWSLGVLFYALVTGGVQPFQVNEVEREYDGALLLNRADDSGGGHPMPPLDTPTERPQSPPTQRHNVRATMQKILSGHFTPPPESLLGSLGRDLLVELLEVNPLRRATANALLDHAFFKVGGGVTNDLTAAPAQASTSVRVQESSTDTRVTTGSFLLPPKRSAEPSIRGSPTQPVPPQKARLQPIQSPVESLLQSPTITRESRDRLPGAYSGLTSESTRLSLLLGLGEEDVSDAGKSEIDVRTETGCPIRDCDQEHDDDSPNLGLSWLSEIAAVRASVPSLSLSFSCSHKNSNDQSASNSALNCAFYLGEDYSARSLTNLSASSISLQGSAKLRQSLSKSLSSSLSLASVPRMAQWASQSKGVAPFLYFLCRRGLSADTGKAFAFEAAQGRPTLVHQAQGNLPRDFGELYAFTGSEFYVFVPMLKPVADTGALGRTNLACAASSSSSANSKNRPTRPSPTDDARASPNSGAANVRICRMRFTKDGMAHVGACSKDVCLQVSEILSRSQLASNSSASTPSTGPRVSNATISSKVEEFRTLALAAHTGNTIVLDSRAGASSGVGGKERVADDADIQGAVLRISRLNVNNNSSTRSSSATTISSTTADRNCGSAFVPHAKAKPDRGARLNATDDSRMSRLSQSGFTDLVSFSRSALGESIGNAGTHTSGAAGASSDEDGDSEGNDDDESLYAALDIRSSSSGGMFAQEGFSSCYTLPTNANSHAAQEVRGVSSSFASFASSTNPAPPPRGILHASQHLPQILSQVKSDIAEFVYYLPRRMAMAMLFGAGPSSEHRLSTSAVAAGNSCSSSSNSSNSSRKMETKCVMFRTTLGQRFHLFFPCGAEVQYHLQSGRVSVSLPPNSPPRDSVVGEFYSRSSLTPAASTTNVSNSHRAEAKVDGSKASSNETGVDVSDGGSFSVGSPRPASPSMFTDDETNTNTDSNTNSLNQAVLHISEGGGIGDISGNSDVSSTEQEGSVLNYSNNGSGVDDDASVGEVLEDGASVAETMFSLSSLPSLSRRAAGAGSNFSNTSVYTRSSTAAASESALARPLQWEASLSSIGPTLSSSRSVLHVAKGLSASLHTINTAHSDSSGASSESGITTLESGNTSGSSGAPRDTGVSVPDRVLGYVKLAQAALKRCMEERGAGIGRREQEQGRTAVAILR